MNTEEFTLKRKYLRGQAVTWFFFCALFLRGIVEGKDKPLFEWGKSGFVPVPLVHFPALVLEILGFACIIVSGWYFVSLAKANWVENALKVGRSWVMPSIFALLYLANFIIGWVGAFGALVGGASVAFNVFVWGGAVIFVVLAANAVMGTKRW